MARNALAPSGPDPVVPVSQREDELMKKITVVTISYNQGQFLEDAIQSVVTQDYPQLEYIVVDAGSTDDSLTVLDRYPQIMTIVGPDEGPADGLNKGFEAATGDVLYYLNADDIVLPGVLRRVEEIFRDAPPAVVYGDGLFLDQSGAFSRPAYSDPFSAKAYARGAVCVLQQATFFSREVFLSVGGFRKENRTCWDAEFIVDAHLAGFPIDHVPQLWGGFRIHSSSITGSGRLTDLYGKDRKELNAKLLGRPQGPLDAGLSFGTRAAKRAKTAARCLVNGVP
jgi:glycosyltransferase involved in cell wall biosynthesis